jgi:general secretion pathway protein D
MFHSTPIGLTSRTRRRLAVALATLTLSALALAQQPTTQRITPNFKDADITQIIEAVSMATGKNFIIDPRVRAQVTMLSSTPMTPDQFYQAFLAILQVHGFVAVPAGNIVKIVPDANMRQYAANDLPEHVSSSSDEMVTQVLAGAAAADAAECAALGRHGREYPDPVRSRQQREPHDADHCAHRSGR